MHSNFDVVFKSLMTSEGGYVNNPKDPGGPTKWGVTQATLASWRGRDVTADDVKALGVDEAKLIFRKQYWDKMNGDELPDGLDLAVTDMAYNSGPGRAATTLQRALNKCGHQLVVDGQIGLNTTAAVQQTDVNMLIDAFAAERLAFLRTTKGWNTFGRGWTNRVESVTTQAHGLSMPVKGIAAVIEQPPMQGSRIDHDVKFTRTVSGQAKITAGLGAMGTAATDAANQIAPLSDYLPTLKWIFVGLTIVGIAIGAWETYNRLGAGNVAPEQ